ncbi:MAG: glycosyltransferase family 4 protein [Ignavibacteriaceae bacterium]
MRLLFTLENFPPSTFGGISQCVYPVIKELAKTNNEIIVLTTNFKMPIENTIHTDCWINSNGFSIKYVKTSFPSISLKYLSEGIKLIKNVDQLHLNSFFYFPNFVFAINGIIYRKKVIWSTHGELFKPVLRKKYWKKAPYAWLAKFLSSFVTFRATSYEETNQIRLIYPKANVVVIPNFFELSLPLFKNKVKQFVFLGRISRIKKIENLILACSISNKFIDNNYTFVIAGPIDNQFKKYHSYLNELVCFYKLNNKIFFLGEVISPQKEHLLSESKALFLISDSENFGNVVVESLAQGTPVVASMGTPWQSLEDKNSGYWIDNSPESIAIKMDEIISMNEESYKIISANSIAHSKEFSKEKILLKWIEAFKINH